MSEENTTIGNDNLKRFDMERLKRRSHINIALEEEARYWEEQGESSYDVRCALLNSALRRTDANPYRDPVDVAAVKADLFFLELAMDDISRRMEQLHKALARHQENEANQG